MGCFVQFLIYQGENNYPRLLKDRRKLMAQKMKTYFMGL